MKDWRNNEPILIDGILHLDESRPPSRITILRGGVGRPYVTFNIITYPGVPIKSFFSIFYSPRAPDPDFEASSEEETGVIFSWN